MIIGHYLGLIYEVSQSTVCQVHYTVCCFCHTCTVILVSTRRVECLKYFTTVAPVSQLWASGMHLVGVQLLVSIVASWLHCGKKGRRAIFTLVGGSYTKATGLCVHVGDRLSCFRAYKHCFPHSFRRAFSSRSNCPDHIVKDCNYYF